MKTQEMSKINLTPQQHEQFVDEIIGFLDSHIPLDQMIRGINGQLFIISVNVQDGMSDEEINHLYDAHAAVQFLEHINDWLGSHFLTKGS